MYSKPKDVVRTNRTNSLFQSIPLLKRVLDENKKGNSKKNCLKSSSVPRTGIEPAHPCERPDFESAASTNSAIWAFVMSSHIRHISQ